MDQTRTRDRNQVELAATASALSALDRQTRIWLVAWAAVVVFLLARTYAFARYGPLLISIGSFRLSLFGPLVAVGVAFGFHLIKRKFVRDGVDWQPIFGKWVRCTVIGFVVSHVFEAIAYHPNDIGFALLNVRAGYSSVGGFLGATAAALFYFRDLGRKKAFRYFEVALYGVVGAWLFGRAACFSAHDHLGAQTHFVLGVPQAGVVRHELGLYELLLTIPLFFFLFWSTKKSERWPGFVTTVVTLYYAPVRFALDAFRQGDLRYWGLTPAQWMCLPFFALGIYFLIRRVRRGPQ